MRTILILIFLIFMSGMVHSAVKLSVDKKLVYQDLVDGYVRCAAYFSVSSKVIKNSNEEKLAKTYGEYSKKLYKLSNKFATILKNKKQAKKFTRSRYDTYKKNMLHEINNNGSDISILMDKHMQFCEVATSSLDGFINLIIDNQLKK